jgi:hypothetical protein
VTGNRTHSGGYFVILQLGNAFSSSVMPGVGDLGVAETGVMVGRLRTSLGKTSFPETSASHRPIPRELVQLVATLSYGRNPLTIGVISRR